MSRALAGRLPSMERTVVVCELQGPPDLAVLDALARLVLVARRRGVRCELQVSDPALLRLTGLAGPLLQPVGQAEAREERLGVQEVVQVDQPPA